MLKTALSCLHSSRRNTGMWRTDRQTDRETESSGYNSGLHCEQCARRCKNYTSNERVTRVFLCITKLQMH